MREVVKYLSGGVIVYFVMAACSAGGSGGGRRAGNDLDASVGGTVTGSNGGTGAGNGGTGQGNAGTTPGTGGSFIVNPVPPAMAQPSGETLAHSGVVDVACAQVGTTTTTITNTNPNDGSIVFSVTSTYTHYEAAITDAAVTLSSIRYAFVQLQGPPVTGTTDACATYANQPNYTCTTQGSIPAPTGAPTFVPTIGEGRISVSCGYLSESTSTSAGQAPETTTVDTRQVSAKFSYGTAS
ncbi:MAG TPA: hypothetical protein VHO25_07365 [Polyangiaceae bacterium]|nr:hypothetical protein [Polyangiaceae bacterium]